MQSKAATVEEYLAALPEDRRTALNAVRRIILRNLDRKNIEEGMQYGMIGYFVPHRVYPPGYHCDPKQPLPFAGLASQKNHMSLYLMCHYGSEAEMKRFQQEWKKTGKKLDPRDMGKSCIRFKQVDGLALDAIGAAIRRMTAKKYIEQYEEAIKPKPTTRKKTAKKKSAKTASRRSTPECVMGTRDPRVDEYIEKKAADFARPILRKLRTLAHKGCPDIEETIKWGMPSFEYKGPFIGMAAFKQHCAFGFWKAAILFADQKNAGDKQFSWGAPGRDPIPARITSLDDLPADAKMLTLIRKAKKLNDDGVKIPKEKTAKKPIPLPKDFENALKKTKGAKANFEKFPPSHKREYIAWITEAKREETRRKRITTAVEWIAEGKSRNWKYQKKGG